jgi:hypothetical protein
MNRQATGSVENDPKRTYESRRACWGMPLKGVAKNDHSTNLKHMNDRRNIVGLRPVSIPKRYSYFLFARRIG